MRIFFFNPLIKTIIMNRIFYLKTCDTCKKILKQIDPGAPFELREIKEHPITEKELEEMYEKTKSYEALFNKRAQLYKERNLKDQSRTENDYKKYLLEHYTFLARPVIFYKDRIFVGNAKKTIEEALSLIH